MAVRHQIVLDKDVQAGSFIYAADTGSSDEYAITLSPAISAYVAGQEFGFKANTANTGSCTLNINGVGNANLKKRVSDNLETGDILAGQLVKVKYDGTNFQVISPLSKDNNLGDVVGPASAVNNNVAVFDGTTGELIKDGGSTLAEKANVNSPTFTGTVTMPTQTNSTPALKIPAGTALLTPQSGVLDFDGTNLYFTI